MTKISAKTTNRTAKIITAVMIRGKMGISCILPVIKSMAAAAIIPIQFVAIDTM